MKIRIGFVSNSSSSSFIVGFDHRPTSKKELQQIMFPNISSRKNILIDDDYGLKLSVSQVAARVWEDLQKQKASLTEQQIIEQMLRGYVDGIPDHFSKDYDAWQKITETYQEKYGDEYHKRSDYKNEITALNNKMHKRNLRKARHFLETNSIFADKEVFVFEYASDSDDTTERPLRWGNIFRNLPHVEVDRS
jgi:hypothetical protein